MPCSVQWKFDFSTSSTIDRQEKVGASSFNLNGSPRGESPALKIPIDTSSKEGGENIHVHKEYTICSLKW